MTSDLAGIDCPGDCSEAYPDGTMVELTALAASGSTFSGWTGACTGMTCTLDMTVDRALSAQFDLVAQEIFDDGFESANVCLWTTAVGAPPCPP